MMFRKKQPDPAPAPEFIERLRAIAAKSAPPAYADDSERTWRAPRNAVFRQATATLEGGEKLPVVIKNLSSTGCRIEFYRQTPLTKRLKLDESSVPISFTAIVVWHGDGAAGLRFVQADEN